MIVLNSTFLDVNLNYHGDLNYKNKRRKIQRLNAAQKKKTIYRDYFYCGCIFSLSWVFFHYHGCFFIIVCVFSLSWVLFPYSINSKIFNMCIHQLGFYRECMIYVSQPLYSRPIIDHFGLGFTAIEPLWQICKIKKMNHGQKKIYLSPK